MTVRELNGWAPSTVTLDADGNVLSVTAAEPRFTRADVDILLASRRLERSRNEHGIPMSEALDPANQFRYRVVGPFTDWSAEALRRAQDVYKKTNPDADMSSLRWDVEAV